MSLLRSPVLGPVQAGRGGSSVAPMGPARVSPNPPPLHRAACRKNRPSSYSSWRLIPALTGLHSQMSTPGRSSNLVAERRPVPVPARCFSNDGGWRDETGVEDEDADIDEILARLQEKLVVNVHPLQETRSEEEEAVRKGREMLFQQFCLHLGVSPQEFRTMWWARGGQRGHGADSSSDGAVERLRLVRNFLEEEWGSRYRPLSPRAAVEMLDEHMGSLDEREAAIGGARPSPPAKTPSTAASGIGRRLLLPNWWR